MTRLVGRARELSVLRHRLDLASSGEGGMVFLVGEAGIGKTRLMEELSRYAPAWRQTGRRRTCTCWLVGVRTARIEIRICPSGRSSRPASAYGLRMRRRCGRGRSGTVWRN